MSKKGLNRALAALFVILLLAAGVGQEAVAKSNKKKKATATPYATVSATPAPTQTKTPKPTKTKKPTKTPTPTAELPSEGVQVTENGQYTDREHVAAYLRAYGKLPSNYITKNRAQALGWVASRGNLWQVAPGKSIGGDRFGNYEGNLPDAQGRRWFECDIDFDGTYRNAKRILYSNDGLIYYTEDHYQTFVDITVPETRAGP
ncbi:MAG: ribonuclease [Clostridia bacterium]|nr:ribonuclease [Clostridia bacterium]